MGAEYAGADVRIGASSNSSSCSASASGDHHTSKVDEKSNSGGNATQHKNTLLSSKHDETPTLDTSIISPHNVTFEFFY